MNITLSIDDQVVARCREVARDEGRSLNDIIREYLEGMARPQERDELIQELIRLWETSPGDSGGKKMRRADAYEGRL